MYAVEDRLGFVKSNTGVGERKFVDLSSETKSREFLQMMAEKSLVENRPFTPLFIMFTALCKPYGLVGNVRRGAAVLPTNFGGGRTVEALVYLNLSKLKCFGSGSALEWGDDCSLPAEV